ncbi:TolC family protein [Sphingobacteriaceae bacterium WQ 2009]|uniref:TolC family protein n=1 Tax=Rhinopithecimicrobium faecis TaxID=2820698 RepID=A0A8T4HC60_9SPHI|nr:TolC family protein [Sphingobacteriaceae bacterium WQ 2009]
MKLYLVLGWLFGSLTLAYAQEKLTVKEAIAITLENNFDIQLAENTTKIAQENLSLGNAGFLPTVTANLNQNNSLQNLEQIQNSGEVRSMKNAKNNSLNYGLNVGWTIFDGLGMFTRYKVLDETEKRTGIAFKKSVLTQVSDVLSTYYSIVEQKTLLAALDTTIQISADRLKVAENRFEIGKASRLEVLNAQVNLNEDQSNKVRQQAVVKNLKTNLNRLMGRMLTVEFDVLDEVTFQETMLLPNLQAQALTQNPDLQLIAVDKTLAELQLKATKANRLPVIRLNAGYIFSDSESSLGFVKSSNAKGLNYGATIALNVFDGFNQRRNERVSKLQIKSAEILLAQQQQLVESTLLTAFEDYQTNRLLIDLEENNEKIARQNLRITLDKFRIGTVSTVEFRDAQENYINAVARRNAAVSALKRSEIQVEFIAGNLRIAE